MQPNQTNTRHQPIATRGRAAAGTLMLLTTSSSPKAAAIAICVDSAGIYFLQRQRVHCGYPQVSGTGFEGFVGQSYNRQTLQQPP